MATKEEDKVRSTSRTEMSDEEDQDLPILEEMEDETEVEPEYVIQDAEIIRNAEFVTSEEDKKKTDWKKDVPEQFHKFHKVFETDTFDQLPECRPWDHAIDLKPGSEPVNTKVYPMSPSEQEQLDAFIEENLSSGRIRPSKSPMASPCFFIKKKDGSLRLVQDYRKLNDMTVKNRYPLPLIPELLDKIKEAKFFSKLDIRWGYNNIRIKEGDEWKGAFRTNRGSFEPLVMFFGLCNSPGTFQSWMDHIFREHIGQSLVIIYMDDILIFARTKEEHDEILHQVLQILQDNNLCVKPSKCKFEVSEVDFLGFIVGNGQLKMDPSKISAVKDWKIPQTKKQLQSFLGFANFYRKFIKDFAKDSLKLTPLTGKVEWNWGEEQTKAFERLVQKLCAEPILTTLKKDGHFKVETDGSGYAMGAVLMQEQEGEWKTLAYYSATFIEAKCNYSVEDREMLAIVKTLDHWRQYLLGAPTIEIWTDHLNLQSFKSPIKINRRQARWVLKLADFDFTIHHIPGVQNKRADALSRKDGLENMNIDNENVIILPEEKFRKLELKNGFLYVKLLSEKATCPIWSSEGAAGFDLYSAESVTITPGKSSLIKMDISIVIPGGTYARIAPRSGLAVKNMINTGAGIVDYDYRGEIKVLLFNHGEKDFHVTEGDRIAQLILERIITPPVMTVEDLDDTERGEKGFGSSGIRSLENSLNFGENLLEEESLEDFLGRIPVIEGLDDSDSDGEVEEEESVYGLNEQEAEYRNFVVDLEDIETEKYRKIQKPENKEYVIEKDREKIIYQNHDIPMAGHPGVKRTIELVSRTYWWETLRKDIEEYVRGCERCQRNKIIRQKKNAPLQPMDPASEPWERISVDLVGPLPKSQGYNMIMVVSDHHR